MTANVTLRESARTYTREDHPRRGAADPTTRLVQVTATIDDERPQVLAAPGAFCDVNVPIGDARQGIVVPSLAVQPTEKGNVVYTVDAGNIAHAKSVALGMHTPEGGVEITQGLSGRRAARRARLRAAERGRAGADHRPHDARPPRRRTERSGAAAASRRARTRRRLPAAATPARAAAASRPLASGGGPATGGRPQ